MTKKRKTRIVDKNQYHAFLAKAKDFASMMDVSLEQGKWNSAGLQAVHTVISASDAVIVYYGGVRSSELDHREVVGLLHDIIGESASSPGRHVSRVIAKKNLVEYEERLIIQSEARDMVEHAKRFLDWVNGILPNMD
ncbi:MAG: HEPN domain-containing protein [Deltaproteobacteria bacterium]|nr:HEPN domain-containing protein [Deltaproteobacteria bacterium]